MAKKNVKSEEPKKKKPISLNILEIAKRLQKLEEIAGTPYTLPTASADTKGGVKIGDGLNMTGEVLSADEVGASDVAYGSGTVKDALDAVMPRTASGTTVAQLVTAIGQLSETQKTTCIIDILYAGVHLLLRREQEDYYTCTLVRNSSSTNGTISQYYLNTAASKFSYVLSTGTTSTDQSALSVTSWTLYYQGTPIS